MPPPNLAALRVYVIDAMRTLLAAPAFSESLSG